MNEIKSRINARWHDGQRSFPGIASVPRLECTGDIYQWLDALTSEELCLVEHAQCAAPIFTKRHEGDAVVYSHPDGGSVSATISWVKPRVCVQLRYAVPYGGERTTIVARAEWHRLTKFGNNLFLAIP